MSLALQSREYKLMLHAPQFAGSPDNLESQIEAFWRDFGAAVGAAGLSTAGALTRAKQRPVTFYDTPQRHLNNPNLPFRDYVFRARGRDDGSARVTLKYRHPDRVVAGDRDMRAARKIVKKRDTRFEKDIKPAFGGMRSLYSYSSSGRTTGAPVVNTVGDIMAMFPGIEPHLDVAAGESVFPVGGFTASELVFTGSTLSLTAKVVAECAAIIWHDASGDPASPVLAEFSFRRQKTTPKDRFGATEARAAYLAFRTALTMNTWIDPQQQTKTAYVYNLP
ncbi:MAG: hypothetical protein O3A25_03425 [Acidobacteria bacterium]|nr:hypothetical protein [Acidobacteriota bacterium]